jgi:hypothetical protein
MRSDFVRSFSSDEKSHDMNNTDNGARGFHRGRTASLLLVGATVTVGALGVAVARAAPDTGTGTIDDMRAVMEKWVETRRVISHEQREWVLTREVLADRIELVEREIAALREKIAESEAALAETDQTYAELVDRNDLLKDTAHLLQEDVTDLEARTLALISRLPNPIRELVRPLSQALTSSAAEQDAGGTTETSLGIRYQNVAGILNLVNKFNREISTTSEVRPMTDGSSSEVTAMYIGLGQAYYVNSAGTRAGLGRPGVDGFVWSPLDTASADISRAIAVLKNEQIAEFVPLPIVIDE